MLIDPETFDLAELATRSGVSPRTVRYYIQQGLLPAPETRGPGAHYGAEHVDRLRLIRRLQREHLPLAEIRRRISGLDASQVRLLLERTPSKPTSASQYIRTVLAESHPVAALLCEPTASLRTPASLRDSERAPSPPAKRSQWDRIALADDVELHIRRPLSREQNRQVERLIDAARHIFQGEP